MASCVRQRFFGWFVFLCGFFVIVQVMLLLNQQKCNSPDEQTNLDARALNSAAGDKKNNIKRNDKKTSHRDKRRETATKFPVKSTPSDNNYLSPFHRRWEANCSAIFAGDTDVVQATYRMLKKERHSHNGSIVVPEDREVRTWTHDCDSFRSLRRYPTHPVSEEEDSYPVAYIIAVHKEAAQVERLLRAIYQPQNLYCIHPDAKSPEDFQRAIKGLADCFENVFISSKIEDVQYAGFTRLLADINCMKDLVGPRGDVYRWKYVMNLCGQDFPLKTNLEIVRQLRAYKGHNDITGVLPPSHIIGRTRYKHVIRDKQVKRTHRPKTPPPHNLRIHFGNAYYAATRRFVEYILTSPKATDLLRWSNDTFSPDEHYWATLQRAPGTPGGYPDPTWDENVRFMKWGDITKHPSCKGIYVRGLCVFGVAYLEYLATQPHLFANKFYYSFDPIAIQCIEEALLNRTRNPALSDRLPNFPVTNLLWQSHTALP
ncbi:N-acetyllactosaminide beta-1,6-N-acetylglucosaminyl-transferase-like [Patiria miniata]|uniref:Beta-1,3-galactosyl-O-glycosyl-glycoprotein beta-1,6-N-acetylglucosaminyltransferase n=1 Tax=Patiria miniata TaxID=46514 RepID=A0A914BPM1_PATMI|nr:N-acetyllactosaminide beta-1,6-N-acetylglucosaminyl-transferase-like [Patiria miniata]XP_038077442.1 N-acetyllactosaminide beta-1,6-N-acetylglucosaminyl-transferase-like [Patiria miniata]